MSGSVFSRPNVLFEGDPGAIWFPEQLTKNAAVDNVLATDFTGQDTAATELSLNQIGEVAIKLAKPLFYDKYVDNKQNGSFILIDPQTNHTAGVGFVE